MALVEKNPPQLTIGPDGNSPFYVLQKDLLNERAQKFARLRHAIEAFRQTALESDQPFLADLDQLVARYVNSDETSNSVVALPFDNALGSRNKQSVIVFDASAFRNIAPVSSLSDGSEREEYLLMSAPNADVISIVPKDGIGDDLPNNGEASLDLTVEDAQPETVSREQIQVPDAEAQTEGESILLVEQSNQGELPNQDFRSDQDRELNLAEQHQALFSDDHELDGTDHMRVPEFSIPGKFDGPQQGEAGNADPEIHTVKHHHKEYVSNEDLLILYPVLQVFFDKQIGIWEHGMVSKENLIRIILAKTGHTDTVKAETFLSNIIFKLKSDPSVQDKFRSEFRKHHMYYDEAALWEIIRRIHNVSRGEFRIATWGDQLAKTILGRMTISEPEDPIEQDIHVDTKPTVVNKIPGYIDELLTDSQRKILLQYPLVLSLFMNKDGIWKTFDTDKWVLLKHFYPALQTKKGHLVDEVYMVKKFGTLISEVTRVQKNPKLPIRDPMRALRVRDQNHEMQVNIKMALYLIEKIHDEENADPKSQIQLRSGHPTVKHEV